MFELDLLDLNGWNDDKSQSTSPVAIREEGFDMGAPDRAYQWSETDTSDGASLVGDAPLKMVERTVPIIIRPRFTSAHTNLLTNPRPYSVITGWATQGTGSTVTLATADTETVAQAVTTGSANSGMKHNFTATVAGYSAGVWVKVASGTAPIDVKFDGETATSITATTTWQLVKTENKTLTAATRSLQILQTDTGSRTIYVKMAGVVLASTYPGYFDGATGDAKWNGAAHASTSTALISQDAISRTIGLLGEKGAKAIATSLTGGLTLYWQPRNTTYRVSTDCRAVDVSKVDYDTSHAVGTTAMAEVKLTCHPDFEGPEYTAGTFTKAIGANAAEFTITNAKGDRPSPCRLVVTMGPQDQRLVTYGLQARDYSSGNGLTLAATSFTTSGYSGTLTTAANGVQQLTKTGTISGGNWSLGFRGYTFNASFAHNASTATVQSAIDTALGTANLIVVSGNPLSTGNMIFTASGGSMAGQYIPPLTFTGSSLTGGGSVALSTTTAGNPAYVSAGLYSDWTAICDTGNLTHTGDYTVWARVYDNSSTDDVYKATLRLKWSLGDATALEQNDPAIPQAVGNYSLVNLGQIHIPTTPTGTQRWIGIIEGKTSGTAGSSVRVADLRFVPMNTGAGEVRAVDSTASTIQMYDTFSAISGAMAGDSATTGGTWASMGGHADADDFTGTGSSVQRTAVSDTSTNIAYGRGMVLGSTTLAAKTVRVTLASTAFAAFQGVIARFVDNDNFVAAVLGSTSGHVYKVKAGVVSDTLINAGSELSNTLAFTVLASGQWTYTLDGVVVQTGADPDLATGGTLASGKAGIIDWQTSATANTRTYTNFSASALTGATVACYASKSIQFRPDGIIRETSGGGVYGVPSINSQPFQPKLIPAGAEGLTNRGLVFASPSNPDEGPDTFPDALSGTVYSTPVYTFARWES